ncbi:type IV secretory system conjugative DNA transfer family protein [Frankia sp. BMG5.23]|uniref:type IV secretory system conjugative DNA transfer family protein n=1 Tax=Frankia sp. BMG5.23 TaxID=683305 RepID=UPI000461F7D1|nr:TraM recognition domain-containing protein [Frankia sp. BMG5.23]KDA40858.1 type IV secretory pathway, VirD4 component [Frankia sp. BMG5.23]
MSRPGACRYEAAPWVLLGLLWISTVVFGLVWLTARLAAAVGGGQVAPLPDMAGYLLRGRADLAWPGVATGWLIASGLLWMSAVGVLVVLVTRRWRRWTFRRHRETRWRLALPSLAGPDDLAALTPAGVAKRARKLCPSLAALDRRRLSPTQTGWPLGDLVPTGPPLRGTWEDVALAVMAPRAGKTTGLAVPMILDAPGAAVATSNKADLWAATASLRAAHSRVWVFDPQQVAYAEQTWWWNPLAAVAGVEDADRLAGHFLQEIRDKNRDFWSAAAGDLLASLLLAAAVSKRTLTDVYEWLNDSGSPLPAELLAAGGFPTVAAGLRGRQRGAPETREGVYETARTAAKCLRNARIQRWVTPGAATVELDMAAFAASNDTLYLLSKDDEGAASPLVAALTDQVLRAAVRRAESRGGRLDPPMVTVLDEAANVCKIQDLPDLYSHLGSRGVVPLTILQSYRQGVRVWGEPGMDALWSASTIKILGAGIDDARLAEDVSRLVGEHEVDTESVTRSRQGAGLSVSARRQRILEPGDIRAIPKGWALLLATGARAAVLALRPWYTGPHHAEIAAAVAEATAELTARAGGHHTASESIDDRPVTHS